MLVFGENSAANLLPSGTVRLVCAPGAATTDSMATQART